MAKTVKTIEPSSGTFAAITWTCYWVHVGDRETHKEHKVSSLGWLFITAFKCLNCSISFKKTEQKKTLNIYVHSFKSISKHYGKFIIKVRHN